METQKETKGQAVEMNGKLQETKSRSRKRSGKNWTKEKTSGWRLNILNSEALAPPKRNANPQIRQGTDAKQQQKIQSWLYHLYHGGKLYGRKWSRISTMCNETHTTTRRGDRAALLGLKEIVKSGNREIRKSGNRKIGKSWNREWIEGVKEKLQSDSMEKSQ